jgi:quinol-cytochrome oxidoreductase complex cytochrome b subunit
MSIRHFHIFFMSICILFFLGFASWGFLKSGEDASLMSMGILFSVLGLGLIGYLIAFIKKIKKEGLDS